MDIYISKQGTSFGDKICEGMLRLHSFDVILLVCLEKKKMYLYLSW